MTPSCENPRERYLITTFCYGCNLGPTQTARSIKGLDRRQVSFVNQRHVTEENLNQAITRVINAYAQLPLQRVWGSGKSASADGTKWALYPQNLMSESSAGRSRCVVWLISFHFRINWHSLIEISCHITLHRGSSSAPS